MRYNSPGRRQLETLLSKILVEVDHRPRRSLGQSFLVDPRGLEVFSRGLVRFSCSEALEIGSGPGLLTLAASRIIPKIVAAEVDMGLARASAGVLHKEGRVQVVVIDGLFLIPLFECIYSNTPYNLSSKIIAKGAKENKVKEMVLGLQFEVGRRILANPGSRDYGRLTVLTRLFFDIYEMGFLRREWFRPRPKVNGIVIYFKRKSKWEKWMNEFETFTACIFSGRNKMAYKMISKCTNTPVDSVKSELRDTRIRDLSPEEILEAYKKWKLKRLL